ncbi:MAG: lamin tail domain-containing protein [Candidatus Scalindua sp.]
MNNSKKEDGFILVVVIGILTILSLLTITFATLSRIETRATRNYTDSVKCEMVAKAGLEHAIYELRLDKFGTDTFAYNNPNLNYDDNYDWPGDGSWPGDSVFPNTGADDYDNDGGGDDSTWIYFPLTAVAGTSTTAIRLPGNLLARYAVLITDDREARVNINVTGNNAAGVHTSNEGWSTYENDLSFTIEQAGISPGNANIIADGIIVARHGDDSNPGNDIDDDPGKIPNPAGDGIDNDGDSFIDEANEVTNEPSEFNSISPIGDDVPFGLLSEAEIMGTSSYESRLETIFNGVPPFDQPLLKGWLTTYSADTILCPPYPLGTSTATTMLNINALIYNEGAYTNTGTYNTIKKVEMIRDALEAGGITGAVGSAGYRERHQLAVNIKDFIDSDGTSTTYIDVVPDPDETYYGVDKGTPYINEVEANPGAMEFIELYNPYDEDIDISLWTIEGTTMPTVTITDPASILARDYYVIADVAGEDQHVATMDLVDGGEELTLKTSPASGGITVQVTNYGATTGAASFTRSLNDPRPIPLTTGDPLVPWSWATTGNSMGLPNDNLPVVGNDDGWDGATYPSSFFIANRRFSNKGYLGYIHRGSEWSSFKFDGTNDNVFGYITIIDPSMDGIDNDGDFGTDTYDTDGDGDIDINDTGDTSFQSGDFDGKEYRIPGLINVNTAPIEVLASLPDGSGGTLGDTTIATSIFNGSKPYSSIGDLVVKVTDITDTGATKWDKEKPLRSISNLITVRSNVFTVYVTAQITDEALTVFAEKKILAIVDRSVDPIRVRYFRWITE